MTGPGAHSAPEVDPKRKIQWVKTFSDKYGLGKELMPSCHPQMKVLHAMRLQDGKRVVIKTRGKNGSFGNAAEEQEWRMSTEFMMNLPKSGHVAELIEVLEDNNRYYVVMEEVQGEDLYEVLDHNGRLPITDCRDIIHELLVAVADLHEHHLIHKDLKLENVMVDRSPSTSPKKIASHCAWATCSTASGHSGSDTSSGGSTHAVVKLIDFDTVEECHSDGSRATMVVGTDQYIAPEAYGGKYTPAADIFAVGVIAYRLLTGRFPFDRKMFDDEAGENWVGSPKMKQIQARLRHFTIDYTLEPFATEQEACDVCRSMLAADEGARATAAKLLEHAWFLDKAVERSPNECHSRASSRSTTASGKNASRVGSGSPLLVPSSVSTFGVRTGNPSH